MAANKSLPILLGASLAIVFAGSACNLNLTTGLAGTSQVLVVTATGRTGGAETPD